MFSEDAMNQDNPFPYSILLHYRHHRVIAAPEYLTVSSSGPAGEEQYSRMGVYRLTNMTHNKKPIWSRHDGTQQLFSEGMYVYIVVMIMITVLLLKLQSTQGTG